MTVQWHILIILKLGPAQPSIQPSTRPAPLPVNGERDDSSRLSAEDSIHEPPSQEAYQPISNHQISQNTNGNNRPTRSVRKRKRNEVEDNIEGTYLSRLGREDAKEQEYRLATKRRNHGSSLVPVDAAIADHSSSASGDESETESLDEIESGEQENVDGDIPQHETVSNTKDGTDIEKSSRTVFLGNVSTLAIKSKSARKKLVDHLASITSSLPNQGKAHRVESLRFRSTAFASPGIPRKAAFVKKDLMDTTTKSSNAYAVYTTQLAAREASKRFNGSVVLDRHLRADLVAHPAKVDHRRCVFVGNLGFVDDMTSMDAAEDEVKKSPPKKVKEPADVEEGLWRQFGKAGVVESVRVVRDKTTRVGKGFAYVQFEDANAVEKALLYNGKKFPPMLPRILRVTRAKNVKKLGGQVEKDSRKPQLERNRGMSTAYSPKTPAQLQSLSGRASKLFGRAVAAQIKAKETRQSKGSEAAYPAKKPETFVFEGYRASRQQGKGAVRTGGSGRSQGKPRNRSSRRGAEFKAKGRKKGVRD